MEKTTSFLSSDCLILLTLAPESLELSSGIRQKINVELIIIRIILGYNDIHAGDSFLFVWHVGFADKEFDFEVI